MKTWTNFVVEYGVDGFRLDGPNGVAYQSDTLATWDAVARNAAAAGHPIAVFGEVHRCEFGNDDLTHLRSHLKALSRETLSRS